MVYGSSDDLKLIIFRLDGDGGWPWLRGLWLMNGRQCDAVL